MLVSLILARVKAYAFTIALSAGLGFAGFFGGYIKGRIDASEGYKLAQARAERDAARRDLVIQKRVTETAMAAAAALEAKQQTLIQEVQDYEAELAKRGDAGACRVTDDDLKWLHRIR